jgi:Asp/Glu/Hydantoin racemase
MRHIGILAHSADGAALCFLEVVREGARVLGPHVHPEITLSILPMGAVLEHYERGERGVVDDVIFTERCQGRLEGASRAEYVRIIRDLAANGCDAVALSCTEIPLLITPAISPLPTLDSTRLLAREALATAIADGSPQWRGGPIG